MRAVGWASLHGSRGPSLAGRLRRLVLRCNAPLCATNLRRANVWRPLGGGACCDEGYSSSGSGPGGGRGSSLARQVGGLDGVHTSFEVVLMLESLPKMIASGHEERLLPILQVCTTAH